MLTLILSGFSVPAAFATTWPSNGTAGSVQSIHNNQARNGDTITLPAGTFVWTSGVVLTKAITLQGQGIGQTVIKDGVQSGWLINWNISTNANLNSRMTGIKFQDGGRPNGVPYVLNVQGSNTNGATFRWDHCAWNGVKGVPLFNTVIGVVDHINFSNNSTQIWIYGSTWNGQQNGDGSWAAPVNFGSSQFLFIEDCTANNTDPIYLGQFTDAYAGARFVVRHCTLGGLIVGDHGTESTGRQRGGRAMEIYQNTFNGHNLNSFFGGSRSSRVVVHDNTLTNYWTPTVFELSCFRMFYSFTPWRGADGTNAWDVNEPTVFFRGTAAANSSGTTVTVSGANWAVNQWAGYTLRRTGNTCNSNSLTFGEIESNTSNRITYTGNGGYGSPPAMSICAGDSLEIRKVLHAIDQPGRGQGSLITRVNPTPPTGWNDQVTEPCYAWNNGSATFHPHQKLIRAGEHYFNNTPMPGYTPYTYPHPLVTGAGRAVVTDFNGDGSPDFVLQNASTGQTAVWYMDNNTRINSAFGPTPWAGWNVAGVADFNNDGHPDYLLFNPSTGQTWVWYMDNNTRINNASGPTLWGGWNVAGVADFNNDGHPDYLLFRPSTGQTWVWYMDNNTRVNNASGPTLWAGWSAAGVADFNNDAHPDYLLINPTTGETAIWYLNNNVRIGSAFGPTISAGWSLVAP
jgi:FG-GAP-like repeat